MLALDDLCNMVQKNIQEAIESESQIQARLAAKRNTHAKQHSPNGQPKF